jgi:hypothetical protein
MAQTRNRGTLYPFFNLGTRQGWVVNTTPQLLYPQKKKTQDAEWAPGPVLTGAENLAPPRVSPWTAQPIAKHYTNYTIPTQIYLYDMNCKGYYT